MPSRARFAGSQGRGTRRSGSEAIWLRRPHGSPRNCRPAAIRKAQAEARLVISDGAVSLPDGLLELRELAGNLNVSLESGRPSAGHWHAYGHGPHRGRHAVRPVPRRKLRHEPAKRAELTARLDSDDGSFALDLEGRAEQLDALPQVWLELRSEIRDDAPLWVLQPAALPRRRRGSARGHGGSANFPDLPQIAGRRLWALRRLA